MSIQVDTLGTQRLQGRHLWLRPSAEGAAKSVFVQPHDDLDQKLIVLSHPSKCHVDGYWIHTYSPLNEDFDVAHQKMHTILHDPIDYLKYKNSKTKIEVKSKVVEVYNDSQRHGWDGYEAKPISLSCRDAAFDLIDILLAYSRHLVETADIVPESDGSLCFSWQTNDCDYINISLQGDNKLIYDYDILGEDNCGAANLKALHSFLINKINQVL